MGQRTNLLGYKSKTSAAEVKPGTANEASAKTIARGCWEKKESKGRRNRGGKKNRGKGRETRRKGGGL